MLQFQSFDFCNWGNNPWKAPNASTAWRVPGDCYSGFARPVLGPPAPVGLLPAPAVGLLFSQPSAVVLNVGIAAAGQDGDIGLQLFALNANDPAHAANPEANPSYRVVCDLTHASRVAGPDNVQHTLNAPELAALMSTPCDCGITLGFRLCSKDGKAIPVLHFARIVVRP